MGRRIIIALVVIAAATAALTSLALMNGVTAARGWAPAAPGEEPKTFSMIARRPFLYAITDAQTGAILIPRRRGEAGGE